jgi:hypothetical protein
MAIAIMGGLVGATVLTLLFVPALYALWYRVRPAKPAQPEPVAEEQLDLAIPLALAAE